MSVIEALILGIIQGLTEFLPISSSGHIELGKAILGVEAKEDLSFTVVVHGATVLSTIVVFWKDIRLLLIDVFKFQLNESTLYVLKMGFSMIPVLIVGLFFKDQVEQLFFGNILLVGVMLLVTATLLYLTGVIRPKVGEITFLKAFIIGLAQAVAVIPGISRSGATISTSLMLGVKKDEATRFSFLMVLVPIIGANFLDAIKGELSNNTVAFMPLLVGFIAAFLAGLFACSVMLRIVRQGKLLWFAVYCVLAGSIAIISSI
jgi:undecaprenyl-diphosphatase